MNSLKRCILLSGLVVLSSVALTQAQNRERFGISAQAGGVNAVSGEVTMKRQGQEPKMVTSQDDLISGDVLTTNDASHAEILLNPGTYLRLAENSELVLVDNSLDNLQIKLNHGSAIIEATGPDGVEQHIPVVTEQEKLTIIRAGIYRINAMPGVTELLVQKGRVRVGSDPKNIVKGGKKLTFRNSTPPSIAKLTKLDRDDFDGWSKDRGKTLARANDKLSRRQVNAYLSQGSWRSLRSARFGRWGFWAWSPFASCYTFMPFYYGWGSPYGGWYGSYAGYGRWGYYGGSYGIGNNPGYTAAGGSAPTSNGSPAPMPQSRSEFKVAPPAPVSMPAPPPQTRSEGRIKTP
jgi:hypothetical protein